MSSDRQIIGHFQEIVVAESNDDVTILIGSCETNIQGQGVKGQGHSMKTSSVIFQEIGVPI